MEPCSYCNDGIMMRKHQYFEEIDGMLYQVNQEECSNCSMIEETLIPEEE